MDETKPDETIGFTVNTADGVQTNTTVDIDGNFSNTSWKVEEHAGGTRTYERVKDNNTSVPKNAKWIKPQHNG